MSPVATERDVAVLLERKTDDGSIIYLYPVVRDVDVLLSDESGPENLAELLEVGIKPSFSSLQAIFQNSDDFIFEFDESTNTIKATHKNVIEAGETAGTEGEVEYGGEIHIPSLTFDENGHITRTGETVITLPKSYELPTASSTVKGGIILGDGLNSDENGKVSVVSASTTNKGIVSLSSSTDSESEDDAATSKAVKDALDAAIKYVEKAIDNINTEGVGVNYDDLINVFKSSEDITLVKDDTSETFSVSHTNEITATEVVGTEGSVSAGDSISIPAVTIDKHGHIIGHRLVNVELPSAYKLPTASTTEKGGIILGDGLEIDPLSGITSVREGSTKVKGMVQLDSSTDSNSEEEAATPKAVSEAKKAANEYTDQQLNDLVEALEESGVKPTYEGTAVFFNLTEDIEVEKDSEGSSIAFTHTNVIEPGSTQSNESGVVTFNGKFYIPEITYDKNGHITSVAYKTITLPDNPDTNTTYDFSMSEGTESVVEGDSYDVVSKKYSFGFIGSDDTNVYGKVDTCFYRYKNFVGTNSGLVPVAGTDNADKFLKGDGSWATPTNTTYTGDNGIKLDGTVFKHENSVSAGNIIPGSTGDLSFGETIKIPSFNYDEYGHITSAGLVEFKLPVNPNVGYSLTKSGNTLTLTGTDGTSVDVTLDESYIHPTSGVTAGTYKSVTVDENGHITNGSNPTTLEGYGITDAANKVHTHNSDDIESLDASKITGKLPIDVIPKAALERLVPVTDDAVRFTLTTDDVQLGDTVKVVSTGMLYLVKDINNLDNTDGYEPYSTGTASSVDWSGIAGKPSTFTPSEHEHNYAGSSSAGGAATRAIHDSENQVITETYIKSLSVSGTVITYTRGDGSTGTITTQDTNSTYSVMGAATSSEAGTSGLVPAPEAGKEKSFLRGDGMWAVPEGIGTTYTLTKSNGKIILTGSDGTTTEVDDSDTIYTLSSFGIDVSDTEINYLKGVTSDIQTQLNDKAPSEHLHSAYANQNAFSNIIIGDITIEAENITDRFSLIAGSNVTLTPDAVNGAITIASKDTIYTHPEYAANASGLYKVTIDETGHVSAVEVVTKDDITTLGIPSTDTTYSVATSTSNGLMSSDMLNKMDGLDNNVISETQPSNPLTGYTMWYKVLSVE